VRWLKDIILTFNQEQNILFLRMSVVIQHIPLEVFMAARTTYSSDASPKNTVYDKYASHLMSMCKCFTESTPGFKNSHQSGNANSRWKGRSGNERIVRDHTTRDHTSRDHTSRNRVESTWINDKPAERVKIGGKAATTEEKLRKEFFSLMNKLTEGNKEQILKNVLANHVSQDPTHEHITVYVNIIWDMMLRNRDIQNLYIETLLKFVGNESIREYTYEECQRVYNEYIETHKWLPPEAIIDSGEVSEYDEFCDFMKWKKRALAAIFGLNGM